MYVVGCADFGYHCNVAFEIRNDMTKREGQNWGRLH